MKQESFFSQNETKATGKNLDALEFSRSKRDEILDAFGGNLPLSVMDAQKGRPAEEDMMAFGSYDKSSKGKGAFAVSGRGAANGALSVFPQNICKAVILLYSEKGQTILDPFAGHNSRMETAVRLYRNYVGFDVSERFMEFNRSRLSVLSKNDLYGRGELHLHDSRTLSEVYTGEADFCVTSPPYYDIEQYGDEAAQLGKSTTYADFLSGIRQVMACVFERLKPGAFVAWFINDFRRKKQFIPYHNDSLTLLQSVGFTPWDMMVVNLGWTMRAAFATQVIDQQILPKIHEYGLIVRKPIAGETKSVIQKSTIEYVYLCGSCGSNQKDPPSPCVKCGDCNNLWKVAA